MKSKLLLYLLVATSSVAFAAPPPAPVRHMKDLPGFPLRDARRMLPKDLGRSLEVSPVATWVVARSRIYSTKPADTRIVHEEGAGAYDQVIKTIASSYRSTGGDTIESRLEADTLTFNLVVFTIKDGEMAIVIPHSDDARYQGYIQYGDAWIGICKDGKWTQVSHPGDHRR